MNRISILFCAATFIILTSAKYNENPTGKAGRTGAPGETTCAASGCHNSFALNSGTGSVTITTDLVNNQYTPGQTYNISVTVEQSGNSNWGFGLEALQSSGANAGTLTAGTGSHILTATVSGNSRRTVTHSSMASGSNSKTWSFTWSAPASDIGTVTFYAVGMAANGTGNESGDRVYSTTLTANAATSVYELKNLDLSLSMYPNPAENWLNIDLTMPLAARAKGVVLDTQGRIVKEVFDAILPTGYNHKNEDISDLPAGTYLFSIAIEGQNTNSKMFTKK
jgi:hypothetical protein